MAGIAQTITQGLEDIGNWFAALPEQIGNAIKSIFELPEGYMQGKIQLAQTKLNEKLPIVQQIQDTINDSINTMQNYEVNSMHALRGASGDSVEIPQFTIAIPQWGVPEMSIIDLSFYNEYRPMIHNIIKLSAWFFFLYRLLKQLPSLISITSR